MNGRPSRYTKKLANKICRKIESGKSLREICRDDAMPYRGTVMRWAASDRCGFRHQYEQSTAIRAMCWADEIIDIADNGSGDVPRDRLSMDARKWIVAKLLPRYAEKQDASTDIESTVEALREIADRLPV